MRKPYVLNSIWMRFRVQVKMGNKGNKVFSALELNFFLGAATEESYH